jgi:uncharacterized protein YcbK (DUF882 family)
MRAVPTSPLRHARAVLLGAAMLFAAGAGGAAPTGAPPANARVVVEPPRALVPESSAAKTLAWVNALPPIEVVNGNTQAAATIKLYAPDGSVDPAALKQFVRVAASWAAPADVDPKEPLDPRLVQLTFRAAYHFKGAKIAIVSATRRGARGQHGRGHAIDFRLEGVGAWTLATYLRTYPRAGIGWYTHPKTQYVHLDVRERSYHWIDGSPPGVTWREKLMFDPTQEKRDASYVANMDLPEAATATP